MPVYVVLGNWTDQGTRDFGGAVQRGNSFRELVEQAGGRVRELVWTLGEYHFIIVLEAPDDETAATLVLRVAAVGNVRSKTMRAFDADQMSDIIARTGQGGRPAGRWKVGRPCGPTSVHQPDGCQAISAGGQDLPPQANAAGVLSRASSHRPSAPLFLRRDQAAGRWH
jgi:uncharacterized protein with GYD domain